MATDIIARALAANGGGGGGEPVDAYTKAETNDLLATKADKNTSYTKTEVNNLLAEKEDNILSFDTWADYEKVKNTIPADTYFVIKEDEQENPIPSHNSLMNRDANECHPIKSITGLQAELDKKTDATDTAVLKARVDQLVGEVPPGSADEIADARVMVDGKTSQNLGDAIRTQVSSLKETIENVSNAYFNDEWHLIISNVEHGGITGSTGDNSTYNQKSRIRDINIQKYDYDITIVPDSAYMIIVYYNADDTYNYESGWVSSAVTITAGTKFRGMYCIQREENIDTDIVDIAKKFTIKAKNSVKVICNELENTINHVSKKIWTPFLQYYEHGGITPATGDNSTYNQKSRVRDIDYVSYDYDIEITPNNAYMYILIFDDHGNIIKDLGWVEDALVIKAGTIFRGFYCLQKLENIDTDKEEILHSFTIKRLDNDYVENDLYNEVNHTTIGVWKPFLNNYEKGSLSAGDGTNSTYNQKSRVRDIDYVSYDYDIDIIPENAYMILYFYNSEGKVIKNSGWQTSKYTIKAGTIFRGIYCLQQIENIYTELADIMYAFTFKKSTDLVSGRNDNALRILNAAKKHYDSTYVGADHKNNSNLFCLAHITDVHTDSIRYKHFIDFVNANSKINACINTGDYVVNPTDEEFEFMNIQSTKTIYPCIGNHERWGNVGSRTNEELVTILNIPSQNGKTYYSIDFASYKIKMIVLNQYEVWSTNYSQDQINWLIGELKAATASNMHVIIAAHAPEFISAYNDKGFHQRHYQWSELDGIEIRSCVEQIVNAYKHGTSVNVTVNGLTADASFEGEGKFIAYICGHVHADLYGYSPNYSDQLILNSACACIYPSNDKNSGNYGESVSDLTRVEGDQTEDLFNAYVIDTERKQVKVIRIGSSINDQLEKREATIFNY